MPSSSRNCIHNKQQVKHKFHCLDCFSLMYTRKKYSQFNGTITTYHNSSKPPSYTCQPWSHNLEMVLISPPILSKNVTLFWASFERKSPSQTATNNLFPDLSNGFQITRLPRCTFNHLLMLFIHCFPKKFDDRRKSFLPWYHDSSQWCSKPPH